MGRVFDQKVVCFIHLTSICLISFSSLFFSFSFVWMPVESSFNPTFASSHLEWFFKNTECCFYFFFWKVYGTHGNGRVCAFTHSYTTGRRSGSSSSSSGQAAGILQGRVGRVTRFGQLAQEHTPSTWGTTSLPRRGHRLQQGRRVPI